MKVHFPLLSAVPALATTEDRRWAGSHTQQSSSTHLCRPPKAAAKAGPLLFCLGCLTQSVLRSFSLEEVCYKVLPLRDPQGPVLVLLGMVCGVGGRAGHLGHKDGWGLGLGCNSQHIKGAHSLKYMANACYRPIRKLTTQTLSGSQVTRPGSQALGSLVAQGMGMSQLSLARPRLWSQLS